MGRTSNAREKLLQVAFEEIWGYSYGAVSVDQICNKASVKKGSFYHFFPSKSDLAAAALEEHWKSSQPIIEQAFSKSLSPLERIRRYCQLVLDRQSQQARELGRVLGCPFASAGSELSTHNEAVRKKCAELFDRASTYIEDALRDAADIGAIPEQDFSATAQTVSAFIMGMLLHAKMKNDVSTISNLSDMVMRLIVAKHSNQN